MKSHLLLTLILPALLAGSLFADDFSGFRIPRHHVFALTGSGNFSYSHTGDYSTSGSSRQSNWNGGISGRSLWLLDSDPYRSEIIASGSASGGQDDQKTHVTSSSAWSPFYRGAGNKRLSESISLAWDGRAYPYTLHELPVGFEGYANGAGTYQQNWASSWQTDHLDTIGHENHWEDAAWNYNYSVKAGVSVGIGRVRDATTVFDVRVMEKRLKDLGIITGDLSPATRAQIADLLYTKADYSFQHERWNRYFWSEVEKILRADPALKTGTLDAYGLYRISEAIDKGKFMRQRGWFVGPTASGHHSHYIRNETAKQHSTTFFDSDSVQEVNMSVYRPDARWADDFSYGGKVEYHWPYNERWQFDFTNTTLFPVDNLAHAIDATTALAAQYVIADRWRASANLQHERRILRQKTSTYHSDNDYWYVQFVGSLRYYIEDRLSVDFSLQHYQSRGPGGAPWGYFSDKAFERHTDFALGLSYLFAGAYTSGTSGGKIAR